MSISIAAHDAYVARALPAGVEPFAELTALDIHDSQVDFAWATLQRFGVKPAELEDAAQDVFLIVHRKLSTFDMSQPIEGWLYGICRRVAAAYRRKACQRHEVMCERLPEVEDQSRGPEENVAQQQVQSRLDRLLDQLDDDKRVVLVMFEIEGLACEQIASALAIPVGTVYSRLHSARKALQRAAARSDLSRDHERAEVTSTSR